MLENVDDGMEDVDRNEVEVDENGDGVDDPSEVDGQIVGSCVNDDVEVVDEVCMDEDMVSVEGLGNVVDENDGVVDKNDDVVEEEDVYPVFVVYVE